jgi:hypothetical protein
MLRGICEKMTNRAVTVEDPSKNPRWIGHEEEIVLARRIRLLSSAAHMSNSSHPKLIHASSVRLNRAVAPELDSSVLEGWSLLRD